MLFSISLLPYFVFFNITNDIVATIASAAINIIGVSSIPALGFLDGCVGAGVGVGAGLGVGC